MSKQELEPEDAEITRMLIVSFTRIPDSIMIQLMSNGPELCFETELLSTGDIGWGLPSAASWRSLGYPRVRKYCTDIISLYFVVRARVYYPVNSQFGLAKVLTAYINAWVDRARCRLVSIESYRAVISMSGFRGVMSKYVHTLVDVLYYSLFCACIISSLTGKQMDVAEGEDPTKVVTLDLHNQRLGRISNLDNCKKLRQLDLSFNRLPRIEGYARAHFCKDFEMHHVLLSKTCKLKANEVFSTGTRPVGLGQA